LDASFWIGKKVLVTGHTGFKGAWLSLILHQLGARVYGLALPPLTTPNLYSLAAIGIFDSERFVDLRDKKPLEIYLREVNPEIVFHLAAQASVLEGYRNPNTTWTSNVFGTLNLLEVISELSSEVTLVVTTTDKVYANINDGKAFVETDPLGGSEPYSASKVAVEELIYSYRKVFEISDTKIKIAVARAGNVIGGGDFLADRILPDALRAVESKKALTLRNPKSTRPWQHVFDPLSGYISLAEKLTASNDSYLQSAFNFSNSDNLGVSVRNLLEFIPKEFGLEVEILEGDSKFYEAKILALNSSKAEKLINWRARIGVEEAVRLTFDWNKAFLEKRDMGLVSRSQIEKYFSHED